MIIIIAAKIDISSYFIWNYTIIMNFINFQIFDVKAKLNYFE